MPIPWFIGSSVSRIPIIYYVHQPPFFFYKTYNLWVALCYAINNHWACRATNDLILLCRWMDVYMLCIDIQFILFLQVVSMMVIYSTSLSATSSQPTSTPNQFQSPCITLVIYPPSSHSWRTKCFTSPLAPCMQIMKMFQVC